MNECRKYRPSNGSEGEGFMSRFCFRCKRDAAYQNGEGEGCPILADTMAYDVSNDRYPTEWIYDDSGMPTCTAFEPLDAPEKQDPNAAIRDLFDDEAP